MEIKMNHDLMNHDFGTALRHVFAGGSMARAGWNGKGMSVYLRNGIATKQSLSGGHIGGVPAHLFYEDEDVSDGTIMPAFVLNAADGSTVVGWNASQVDVAAHDWNLI